MIGNNGLSKVGAIKKSEGITFLEPLSSGAIQTTTITNNNKSVHSRFFLLILILFSLGVRAEILCHEDGSTMEMRRCFMNKLIIEEQKMDRALKKALKSSDWVAIEINQSQEAWIKYRDAHCGAVWVKDISGTIRFISYPICLVDLTKQRTKEILQSFTRHTDYIEN